MVLAPTDLLLQLVTNSPRDLTASIGGGQKPLRALYDSAKRANHVPGKAADDVAILYELFDMALDNGMASFVYDYVAEVCSDVHYTSSDPNEAFLLDGTCVKAWCVRTVKSKLDSMRAAMTNERQLNLIAGDVGRLAGQGSYLLLIMKALEAPQGMTARARNKAARTKESSLHEVLLLDQTLQVLHWCISEGIPRTTTGRYPSLPEWTLSLQQRRSRSHGSLFLDTLMKALNLSTYPFRNLMDAINKVFLTGPTDAETWQTKMCIFLYYLLDAALITDTMQFKRAFKDLSPSKIDAFHAQSLLDTAAAHVDPQPMVEQACHLLAGCRAQDLSFQCVRALAAQGRPDFALSVYFAGCKTSGKETSLSDAQVLLTVRLQCCMLGEAFLLVRQIWSSRTDKSSQQNALKVLMHQLLEWCVSSSTQDNPWLYRLLQMPFTPEEEVAVTAWINSLQGGGASRAAEHIPLYFLQRGRVAESLLSHAQLHESRHGGEQTSNAAASDQDPHRALRERWLRTIMQAAARALPAVQQNMIIYPKGVSHTNDGESEPTTTDHARPLSLIHGLDLHVDPGVNPMKAFYCGNQPPPFLTFQLQEKGWGYGEGRRERGTGAAANTAENGRGDVEMNVEEREDEMQEGWSGDSAQEEENIVRKLRFGGAGTSSQGTQPALAAQTLPKGSIPAANVAQGSGPASTLFSASLYGTTANRVLEGAPAAGLMSLGEFEAEMMRGRQQGKAQGVKGGAKAKGLKGAPPVPPPGSWL